MLTEVRERHPVTPLVKTLFGERNGEVSPDGRWLAYEANDSGRFEIYVRPFPDVLFRDSRRQTRQYTHRPDAKPIHFAERSP